MVFKEKSMNNDIQVSVCVVTYNQEAYIAECLDSLITQETDFNFEIIVGEDCSTDSTRAILQKYVDKYPDLIIPLFHEKNVGAVENIKQVYEKARGRYIAHIDGDDMALPGKLQKQFSLMENNSQAIICSHNVLEILDNVVVKKRFWNHPEGEYTVLDLIEKLPFFAHSSKFFRVVEGNGLSEILKDYSTLDIELHLYQASMGTILHLEEDLGCHRTNVGISAIKANKLNSIMIERVLKVYKDLLTTYPNFEKEIKKSYASYMLSISYSYAVFESNKNKMRKYAKKSIRTSFFSVNQLLMLSLSIVPTIGMNVLKLRNKIKNQST